MPEKFRYQIQKKENVTYVKIGGIIDEDNKLQELGEKLGGGIIVIDLAEVDRINSCGVRDWVTWLGKLEDKGAQIVIMKASPAIVAQMNLVNNFTGNAIVASFYAPYYCSNCDKEKLYYIDALALKEQGEFTAPKVRCDECDHLMEFDDMEDTYFAFLKHVRVEPIQTILPDDWEQFFSLDETSARLINRERTPTLNRINLKSSEGSLPSFASIPSLRERTGSGTNLSRTGTGLGASQSNPPSREPTFGPVATSPSQVKDALSSAGGKKGSDRKMTMVLIGIALLLLLATLALLLFLLFGTDERAPAPPPAPKVGQMQIPAPAVAYETDNA